jgi:hypothetical protein
MENVISTYNLEVLSKKFNIRIWVCQKKGRRWHFIKGVGEQKLLPSELIFETGELGFFAQGEEFDKENLAFELENILNKGIA